MFWAKNAARRPIWRQIAWSAFLSFGVLYLLVGALVLFVIIRHHEVECDELLALASDDLVMEYAQFGGDAKAMRREMDSDVESHGSENLFLLISGEDGRIIASVSSSESILRKMAQEARAGLTGTYKFDSGGKNSLGREISIRAKNTRLLDGNMLSVGYNVTDAQYNVIHVATLLGASMLLTFIVGACMGGFIARRFASPLSNLARAAEKIANGDYSARVPVSKAGWEISRVEEAFNRMGDENEKTMADLRALTDDIAHDLRTPLTRLKAAAEIAALGCAELKKPLPETVMDESSAMLEMINTMLEISQSENRIDKTPKEEIEMHEFVAKSVDLYSALAEEMEISLEGRLCEEPVRFAGHTGKLQRLLGNLLENAIKFTPKGGRVVVSLSSNPLTLSVANTGPGIANDDIPHVFKRFWRAEKSRSLPGNGLGLALVKAIATSYGANVYCTSEIGKWTTFSIVFRQEDSFSREKLA